MCLTVYPFHSGSFYWRETSAWDGTRAATLPAMARRQSTKIQRSGEEFNRSRYHNAATTGIADEPEPINDPNTQTAWGGSIAVVAILAIAFIQHMVDKQPDQGESEIMSTSDGGLFVALKPDDAGAEDTGERVLHPALNLASARLASGTAEEPTVVDEDILADFPRGLPIGIVGGPASLAHHNTDTTATSWGVCNADDAQSKLSLTDTESLRTTLVAGADTWSGGTPLNDKDSRAMIARPDDENSDDTFLIWGTNRAKLPTNDARTLAALDITDDDIDNAVTVSEGLINSLNPRPDLTAPKVENSGAKSSALPGQKVGDVLVSAEASGTQSFHLVADDGIQPITRTVAELLTTHGSETYTVSDAGKLADVDSATAVENGHYPPNIPELVDPAAVCSVWEKAPGASRAKAHLVLGEQGFPITDQANRSAVQMLASDGAPVTGRYAGPTDRGWFVQIVGNGTEPTERGGLAYIDTSGIRYDIVAEDGADYSSVLTALGLEGEPMPIPDSLARMFASGPDLDRKAATVEHIRDRGEVASATGNSTRDKRENTKPRPTPQTPTGDEDKDDDTGDKDDEDGAIDEQETPQQPGNTGAGEEDYDTPPEEGIVY